MTGAIQTPRDASYDQANLGQLAATIAQRHNLPLAIGTALKDEALGHIDQTGILRKIDSYYCETGLRIFFKLDLVTWPDAEVLQYVLPKSHLSPCGNGQCGHGKAGASRSSPPTSYSGRGSTIRARAKIRL